MQLLLEVLALGVAALLTQLSINLPAMALGADL